MSAIDHKLSLGRDSASAGQRARPGTQEFLSLKLLHPSLHIASVRTPFSACSAHDERVDKELSNGTEIAQERLTVATLPGPAVLSPPVLDVPRRTHFDANLPLLDPQLRPLSPLRLSQDASFRS